MIMDQCANKYVCRAKTTTMKCAAEEWIPRRRSENLNRDWTDSEPIPSLGSSGVLNLNASAKHCWNNQPIELQRFCAQICEVPRSTKMLASKSTLQILHRMWLAKKEKGANHK